MSPRNHRRRTTQDPDPAVDRGPGSGVPDDTISVSLAAAEDRLEVQAQPVATARCAVVASRAYGRRLCRGLRGAGLMAEAYGRAAVEQLPVDAGPDAGPLVVLMETSADDDVPALVRAQGVIGIALLDETTAEAHVAALQGGWTGVASRSAPVDVVVEVVYEAVHGRTLLRSDVARRLTAGLDGGGRREVRARARAAQPLAGTADEGADAGAETASTPSTPPTPEHMAHEAIEAKRLALASSGDGMGEPRSALAPVPGTDVWQQMFDNAWVLWRPDTGACVLCRGGAIATRYAELGGPLGSLGSPIDDETNARGGAYCRFSRPGSAIVWHPSLGIHETHGSVGQYWLNVLGGPEGPWGFPVSDDYDRGGGERAVDFEGGTLVRHDDHGVGEVPREQDFEIDRWLTLLDEPPRRPGGSGRVAVVGVRSDATGGGGCTLFYTAATAGHLARVHDPAVIAASRQIEGFRSRLTTAAPPSQWAGALLRTTIGPQEVLAITGATLPAGVTAEQLHQAELDVWRDIWDGPELPAAATSKGNKLTWAGFAVDGHLEFLLTKLFSLSADARSLFLQAGISVTGDDGRLDLVVADTEQGWRLQNDDAERYIRCDTRLLSLFDAVLAGSVPAEVLGGDPALAAERNAALRQATLDAQFLTVISHAGRLPGWSLRARWTRELRAAVTHNLHLGCLTGWHPYAGTHGDAVAVVRAMVRDFFCGPAVLLAQSRVRFEGPAGHGVLAEAAASFPPAFEHDDPHARFIIAAGARRRVL